MLELKIKEDGEEYIFESKTKDELVNKAVQHFKDTFKDHSDVSINVVYCTSLFNVFKIYPNKEAIKNEIEERIRTDLNDAKREADQDLKMNEYERRGVSQDDF